MALTKTLLISVCLVGFLSEFQTNHYVTLNNVQSVMISFLNNSLVENYRLNLSKKKLDFVYGTFIVSTFVHGAVIGTLLGIVQYYIQSF